eukprot:scaffold99903_cov58-Phaeocystis_antarctica.AAC.5
MPNTNHGDALIRYDHIGCASGGRCEVGRRDGQAARVIWAVRSTPCQWRHLPSCRGDSPRRNARSSAHP